MIYSPSRQKLLNECKRKYYLHYIEGWRESIKKPWLIFGTKFDELLEIYDKHGIDKATEEAKNKFTNEYDIVDAKLLLLHYHEKIGSKEKIKSINIDGEPSHQFKFNLPVKVSFMDNCDIRVTGYIDRTVDDNDYIGLEERKTTSQAINYNSVYWDDKAMDKQIICYSWALSEILGRPINKCYYTVVRKLSKTLMGVKINRDLPIGEYEKAVSEWLKSGKKTVVARKYFWITQDMRDEWLMDLIADDDCLKTMELNAKTYKKMNIHPQYAWPRNQGACDNYGGCPYREYCEGKCGLESIPGIYKK